MREYRIFIGTDAGAFGSLRKIWMPSDKEAVDVGRRLLQLFPGVDVWAPEGRLALMRKDDDASLRTG